MWSALHVLGLAIFIKGLLLTRVHLPDRSPLVGPLPECPSRPAYDRLVMVVVDALRYDMVIADGRYLCEPDVLCHQGHMPFLTSLATNASGHEPGASAARAFRFVAEAPTTTLQRLKVLLSGSPPSFFDVGNSFSAGAMDEDNLIEQAMAAGKRVAFVGDATWTGLFPDRLAEAHPFPCFNVRDLHTVDDGVAAHLPRLLAAPGSWDVLVAHTLGVDHAGHAHGVGSRHMAAKLRQTDGMIGDWLSAMAARAAPGAEFHNTLLLVLGDHGQTLSGDHGGGSDPEVDTLLLAVDVGAYAEQRSRPAAGPPPPSPREGDDEGGGAPPPSPAPLLMQSDFAASLAPLLGLAAPFGNLGVMQLGLAGLAGLPERCLAEAAAQNAAQVMRYLETYAARASLSGFPLRETQTEFEELARLAPGTERLHRMLDFVKRTADTARPHWTQFSTGRIAAGLCCMALALCLQCRGLWRMLGPGQRRGGAAWPAPVALRAGWPQAWTAVALLACVAWQALGIFSFFYLLSEGQWIACGTAAATVLLAVGGLGPHTSSPLLPHRSRVVLFAAAALGLLAVESCWGLEQHSGRGFWRRLTVHDGLDAGKGTALGGGVLARAFATLAGARSGAAAALLADAAPSLVWGVGACSALAARRPAGPGALLAAVQRWVVALTFACGAASQALRGRDGEWATGLSHTLCRAGLSAGGAAVLAQLALRPGGPRGAWAVGAVLLSAVLTVAEPKTGYLLLLAGTRLLCTARLLQLGRRTHGTTVTSGLQGALFLAAAGGQAFFSTGHLCEFAGFVTGDEFQLHLSGALVALETFGAAMLVPWAALVLPDFQARVTAGQAPAPTNGGKPAAPTRASVGATAAVVMTAHTAMLLATAASAAIQRRHLYAWALFAPRFAFQACMCLATDAALLLLTAAARD